MQYQSVNPATGELLQAFEEYTNEQMMAALTAADMGHCILSDKVP